MEKPLIAAWLLVACASGDRSSPRAPDGVDSRFAGAYARLPDDVVLEWYDDNRWETFTLRRSGAFTLRIDPSGLGADGSRPRVRTGTLPAAGIDALFACLQGQHACDLRSRRRSPVPEEGPAWLRLHQEGLACTVAMWSNEWSDERAAGTTACVASAMPSL